MMGDYCLTAKLIMAEVNTSLFRHFLQAFFSTRYGRRLQRITRTPWRLIQIRSLIKSRRQWYYYPASARFRSINHCAFGRGEGMA